MHGPWDFPCCLQALCLEFVRCLRGNFLMLDMSVPAPFPRAQDKQHSLEVKTEVMAPALMVPTLTSRHCCCTTRKTKPYNLL